jgi:hypothetical protein
MRNEGIAIEASEFRGFYAYLLVTQLDDDSCLDQAVLHGTTALRKLAPRTPRTSSSFRGLYQFKGLGMTDKIGHELQMPACVPLAVLSSSP